MTPTTEGSLAGVIEHDGMLWRPSPGAVASAEEFIAARTLFLQLHDGSAWNPWILEERAADIDAAVDVMEQWRRAEQGHRRMSLRQWEARQARRERQREHQRARDDARRERDKARYDEARCTARLRLIELQSSLDYGLTELAAMRDGVSFPAMDSKRRAAAIVELEQKVEGLREQIDGLTSIVGDPEDVVDEYGWRPDDRRELNWWRYRFDREREVRELTERLPALAAALEATVDRQERRRLRSEADAAARDLDRLIAAGPFIAADMCSECATPMAHHGRPWPLGRPCPAWPGWDARLREARAILERSDGQRRAEEAPAAGSKPRPQPLGVVESGLPIAEVIARLTELQQEFPAAEVRRGRGNRWELCDPDA